jgi:hypothetical protein
LSSANQLFVHGVVVGDIGFATGFLFPRPHCCLGSDPTSMTLWGADGVLDSQERHIGANLGMDLVMVFGDTPITAVPAPPLPRSPAPPSLALALMGLVGCPVLLRRRKANSPEA